MILYTATYNAKEERPDFPPGLSIGALVREIDYECGYVSGREEGRLLGIGLGPRE